MNSAESSDIGIRQWLLLRRGYARAGADAALLLGGTGHLLLSADEETHTTAHLLRRVLPDIRRQSAAGKVVLMTGAAPGIDLVFHRSALEWFQRHGVACASVALLPVPPEWLYRDWILRAEAEGQSLSDDVRQRCHAAIMRLLEEAQWRVTLYDAHAADLDVLAASAEWRTQQYRALAACLAEQSDVLIAVLRSQKLGEPGGTAEVVEWRRHPQRIPLPLSTLAPDDQHRNHHRPLIVIDPGVAFTDTDAQPARDAGPANDEAAAVLAQAEAAMRDGNDLRCHDLLSRALKRGLVSRRMEYLRLLALANVGGTQLALEHYGRLALEPQELDEDWLALQGRLEKDLALAGGGDASAHFLRSAEVYSDSFRRWRGPYSGINAATMLLMAGQPAQARDVAQQVRTRLAELRPASESEQFFHLVSGAEAALHLGDQAQCRERLQQANELCVNDVVRRGRTLQQMRRLCERLAADPSVLANLRMPPLLLLRRRPDSGAALSAAARELRIEADIPPGALVFMALLDTVDLDVAEHLLERGAHLYPLLSQPAADAHAEWSSRWGEATAARLRRVVDRAQRLAIVPGFLDEEAEWRAHQLACTALGAALLTALRLGCEWRPAWVQRMDQRVFLRSGEPGEYVDGPPPAPNRRMVGILFADFAGFGRIPDTEMQRFWREVMGTMSTRLSHYGQSVLHSATWGDALHVVTRDASTAAEIAADILQALDQQRRDPNGVASKLELRVAAHYAPAFEDLDALRGTPVFYGSQISFAARIEPVTPPGTVFGSDAFVARLMLESPDRFSAEYAGELELAKKFGAHPLFAVHRRERR
ncbi:TRAFs-binding domain-containing protein [Hydrocarboniphaga sp.]|uniref:TRAFs-binding domain-containing protein n=1 Tax=Hydrocarboniphaga sp. TaxID=2033016 RepID=UPI00263A1281|nr:TRAFs-binding domain-containing protein [Hydrocarboniphaga sp.]